MYTNKKKENFIRALELSQGNVSAACKAVKIGRTTVYSWKDDDNGFKDDWFNIVEEKLDNIETAIYKNALEGDTIAQIFLLKTLGKKRGYIERQEVGGIGGKEIIIKVVQDQQDDEQTRLLNEIQ